MRNSTPGLMALAFAAHLASTGVSHAQSARPMDKITHIVVLYMENRSFDNVFGEFPGANGLDNARAAGALPQVDKGGLPYSSLPPPWEGGPFDVSDNPKEIREIAFPARANAPFAIDKIAPGITTGLNSIDLVHRFYTHRAQINGGKNDLYAAYSDAAGLSMGYYSREAMGKSELWRLARENTLLDRFFMGALGGSFFNHQYLVCACAPKWENPPDGERSILDAAGRPVPVPSKPGLHEDNRVTAKADGDFAVNTTQSVFLNNGGKVLLPAQTQVTIGDRLTDKGIDWAWYSGGFDLATKAGRTDQETRFLNGGLRFQWHHQPFAYYERFNPGVPKGLAERTAHLRDAERLEADIKSGKLPAVTFYKPYGVLNQHPGYAELDKGDAELARVAGLLASGPMKDSYLLVITYDENGGFWDHVAPPSGAAADARADFWGPGSRVPALLVSPFAHKGKIDSTEFETSSILRLITERFNLEPLASPRVQAVNSLAGALDLR